MFWFWMLVVFVLVIGVTVLIAKVVSPPRRPENPDERSRRHEQMTALKASGALRHRKSNRP